MCGPTGLASPAQAAAVDEHRHHARQPFELRHEPPHLLARKHGRDALRPPHTHQAREFARRPAQHLPEKKDQRAQCLVLRAGRHALGIGQMIEEPRDFRRTKPHRRLPAMKLDELPTPHQVGLLGAPAVVSRPHHLDHAVGETHARRIGRRRGRSRSHAVALAGATGEASLRICTMLNQIELEPASTPPKLANQDEQPEVGHYLLAVIAHRHEIHVSLR